MPKKKVEFVNVSLARDCTCNGRPPHSHIAGVDTKHRIWERTEDMPLGVWGEIERPDEPDDAGDSGGADEQKASP